MEFKYFSNGIQINVLNEISEQIDVTALYIAAEKGNLDLVKLLLKHPNVDINMISILNSIYLIQFLINLIQFINLIFLI